MSQINAFQELNLQQLSQGIGIWENVQPILRSTFLSLIRIIEEQKSQINRLEGSMNALHHTMESKANNDTVHKLKSNFNEFMTIQSDLHEIRGIVDTKPSLSYLHECLSTKANKTDLNLRIQTNTTNQLDLKSKIVRLESSLNRLNNRIERINSNNNMESTLNTIQKLKSDMTLYESRLNMINSSMNSVNNGYNGTNIHLKRFEEIESLLIKKADQYEVNEIEKNYEKLNNKYNQLLNEVDIINNNINNQEYKQPQIKFINKRKKKDNNDNNNNNNSDDDNNNNNSNNNFNNNNNNNYKYNNSRYYQDNINDIDVNELIDNNNLNKKYINIESYKISKESLESEISRLNNLYNELKDEYHQEYEEITKNINKIEQNQENFELKIDRKFERIDDDNNYYKGNIKDINKNMNDINEKERELKIKVHDDLLNMDRVIENLSNKINNNTKDINSINNNFNEINEFINNKAMTIDEGNHLSKGLRHIMKKYDKTYDDIEKVINENSKIKTYYEGRLNTLEMSHMLLADSLDNKADILKVRRMSDEINMLHRHTFKDISLNPKYTDIKNENDIDIQNITSFHNNKSHPQSWRNFMKSKKLNNFNDEYNFNKEKRKLKKKYKIYDKNNNDSISSLEDINNNNNNNDDLNETTHDIEINKHGITINIDDESDSDISLSASQIAIDTLMKNKFINNDNISSNKIDKLESLSKTRELLKSNVNDN